MAKRRGIGIVIFVAIILLGVFVSTPAHADSKVPIPKFEIGIGESSKPEDVGVLLKIVMALTLLSLAPSILMSMTSFTRLIIVFSFIRQAIGVPSAPPNQILIGLSLFISLYVMYPVLNDVYHESLEPFLAEKITQEVAIEKGIAPLRTFMLKQTREKDLKLFVGLSRIDTPKDESDLPIHVLIPAFMISELKTAFQIGFMLYIPFIIIDMVVASVLLAMGMMVLPPVLISLPFKLLLFVLVDGWNVLVESLIHGVA